MVNHEQFYRNNRKYANFLNNQNPEDFRKYVNVVLKYSSTNSSFLDVGCGTGIALSLLREYKKIKVTGVEISKTPLNICKNKGLNCLLYDGSKLPFLDQTFDIVGSYNVLEHTDFPLTFLKEQLRVLKKGGYLIIVCPNFLSITNSYHYHTKGIFRKLKNLYGLLRRMFFSLGGFEKMDVVIREDFQPDDDACNVTNPVDILKWSKKNNLTLEYWSSQEIYKKGVINYLDHGVLKYLLGACFFVFRKV